MRRSGKKALIQLFSQASETPFDLSGVSSDGFSRSNEFKFEIVGEVKENVSGYNETYGESIPVGQSAWTADIKSFYNNGSEEVNAVLASMFSTQHNADTNSGNEWYYSNYYSLVIMPDGNKAGHEKFTLSNAVIKNYAPDMPHDDIMTLSAQFSGGKWLREIIA